MSHLKYFILHLLIFAGFVGVVYSQSTCGDTVTVLSGETLTSIGRRCNVSIDELIRLNPGSESQINAGTTLRLPNYIITNQPPLIAITPLSGAPGTPLFMTGNGFPESTEIELRIGSLAAGTGNIHKVITTSKGVFRTEITIPENAQVGENYIIIAETSDRLFTARSYGIEITFNSRRLFDDTNIYLIALGDGGSQGELVACNDSLVPVKVNIEPTVAVLTAGLNHLLASHTRIDGETGLYNALNQSNLRLVFITLENREAVIELVGQVIFTGECDALRIKAQLENIATQFSTIDTASVLVNGIQLEVILQLDTEVGLEPTEEAIPTFD